MTIHLPPHIESSTQAAVSNGRFASLDDAMREAASLLVKRLNHEQAQAIPAAADPAGKPIWERFEEIAAGIPQEAWDQIPADSSEQLDHYLHGTPRRQAP